MIRELAIGSAQYRIHTDRREGRWFAHAERMEDGRGLALSVPALRETEVVDRLTAWMRWQHEHAVALEALQEASRAYHRTIAGSAFANPAEGPTAIELQKESLEAVEAARVRLDEIRARRPE